MVLVMSTRQRISVGQVLHQPPSQNNSLFLPTSILVSGMRHRVTSYSQVSLKSQNHRAV